MSDQDFPTETERAASSGATDPGSPNGWGTPAPERQTRTVVVEHDGTAKSAASPNGPDVRYRLARVGPLSVLRLSAIFSVGLLLIVMAGVAVLYMFLDAIGVLKNIQHLVNSSGLGHHFRFDLGWILTRVLWVGALMALAGSLVATCLAVFYNAIGELGGGLNLTFERTEPAAGGTHSAAGGASRSDSRGWGRIGPQRPLWVGVLRDDGSGAGVEPGDARGDGRGDRLTDAASF
jgi:hypothetical protein